MYMLEVMLRSFIFLLNFYRPAICRHFDLMAMDFTIIVQLED